MVVTIDQLLGFLGAVLVGMVGYFVNRELAQIDGNLKELADRMRDFTEALHGIDNRLSVAEEQLERPRRR